MKIQKTNLKVFIPVVGRGRGLAHLGGEEVGESLAGEPVDVVDRVPGGNNMEKLLLVMLVVVDHQHLHQFRSLVLVL